MGRAEIEDPARAGIDGRIEDLDPVDRIDDRLHREPTGAFDVESAKTGPFGDELGRFGQERMVERRLRVEGFEDGRERSSATDLAIEFGLVGGGNLFACGLHGANVGGRTRHDDRTSAVADAHDGVVGLGERLDDFGDALRLHTRNVDHRFAQKIAASADDRRGGADHTGDRQDFGVVGAFDRRFCQMTLRVCDDGDGGGQSRIDALTAQRAESG